MGGKGGKLKMDRTVEGNRKMNLIKKKKKWGVGQEDKNGLRMDVMLGAETIAGRECMQGGQLFSLMKMLRFQ